MTAGRSIFVCAAALLALAVLLSMSSAHTVGFDSARTGPAAPRIRVAEAEVAQPPEDRGLQEFNRVVSRNPGTLLGGIALPIILLLTILARRRHYVWFSLLIGAVAGA